MTRTQALRMAKANRSRKENPQVRFELQSGWAISGRWQTIVRMYGKAHELFVLMDRALVNAPVAASFRFLMDGPTQHQMDLAALRERNVILTRFDEEMRPIKTWRGCDVVLP